MIEEYLSQFEGEVRQRLEQIRQTIREEAPGSTEVISYAMPTFDLKKKHLIHYAGYKNHIGIYPTPHGITTFEAELAPYKKAKGSVQFPHNQPIPFDLLRRIVRARVAEVLSKG